MTTTIHQLRSEAKRLGCTIEVDNDCQCYRATAPSRMRFDPGLHELIAVFGDGFIGNGATKAEAREDLAFRLRGYANLEECDTIDCDWCCNWTELELRALRAAIKSSAGNGHDFGFTEDIVAELSDLTPQQVGALISSLIKKGVFSEPPGKCNVNGEYTVTQYELHEAFQDRKVKQ